MRIVGLKPKPIFDFAWTYDGKDSMYITGGQMAIKNIDPYSDINSNLFVLMLNTLEYDFIDKEWSISFDIVKS